MAVIENTIYLSSAYLPPISWFMAAQNAGKLYIEAFESYPRQTYRNRCVIISANGMLQLSVPVKRPNGKGTLTRDIQIAYEEPWQRNHLRTLHAAYSNSPFYMHYIDELMPFFEKKHTFLLDYNLKIISVISKQLGLSIEPILTEHYEKLPAIGSDLRNTFSPKVKSQQEFTPYHQVFEERHGFIPDLSIIDLIFNEGPEAHRVLNKE